MLIIFCNIKKNKVNQIHDESSPYIWRGDDMNECSQRLWVGQEGNKNITEF